MCFSFDFLTQNYVRPIDFCVYIGNYFNCNLFCNTLRIKVLCLYVLKKVYIWLFGLYIAIRPLQNRRVDAYLEQPDLCIS